MSGRVRLFKVEIDNFPLETGEEKKLGAKIVLLFDQVGNTDFVSTCSKEAAAARAKKDGPPRVILQITRKVLYKDFAKGHDGGSYQDDSLSAKVVIRHLVSIDRPCARRG